MPISPTPPSGAKTSSSDARAIMDSDQLALPEVGAGNMNTSPAATVVVLPSGRRSTRPAGLGRSPRSARRPHDRRDVPARLRPARPRARANRYGWSRSPPRRSIARARPSILTDNAPNRPAGETAAPAAARSVAGYSMSAGWFAQLMPMPIDDRAVLAFDQDAGELGTGHHQIVRPFDRQPRLEAGTRPPPPRRGPRAPRQTTAPANAPAAPDAVSNRLA